jgi:hypothetical protein
MPHDPLEGSEHAPVPRPEARRRAAERHDRLHEVRDPQFPVALRGYEREAVEAYVIRVNQVLAELEATSSPDAAVRRALDRVGEETTSILERAHQTSDEIEARSRAQADDRVQRAQREATEAIAAAEARVGELDDDADAVWQERQRLVDDVRVLATELLALADAAVERYPVERPEGPPPGTLTEPAIEESVVDELVGEGPPEAAIAEDPTEPFDHEGRLEEPAVEDLPPPDPAEAASADADRTDELPPRA